MLYSPAFTEIRRSLAMMQKNFDPNECWMSISTSFPRIPGRYFDALNRGGIDMLTFQPFGNGMRGCIGRAFALQESTIAVALLLQNFDFELYDPEYKLAVRKTLTVKPKDFFVRARLQEGLDLSTLQRRLLGGQTPGLSRVPGPAFEHQRSNKASKKALKDLLICYGSNTGTCHTLAFSLARAARSHGFCSIVMSMDEATHKITSGTPIVIVTASYDGSPPDNAAKFVTWLERLTDLPFSECHHAVFGCGNRDWVDTFQRIPKVVDDVLIRCGSKPLVKRGVSDAANNNIFNEFDHWADNSLWPALTKQYSTDASNANKHRQTYFEVIQSSRISQLLQDGSEAIVQQGTILTSPEEPEKREIKLRLTKRLTYAVGDYLAILPINQDRVVQEILTRFGLAIDSKLVAENGAETSAYTFLRENVELNQVATEKVGAHHTVNQRSTIVIFSSLTRLHHIEHPHHAAKHSRPVFQRMRRKHHNRDHHLSTPKRPRPPLPVPHRHPLLPGVPLYAPAHAPPSILHLLLPNRQRLQ